MSNNTIDFFSRWEETHDRLGSIQELQQQQRRVREAQEKIVLTDSPLETYEKLDDDLRGTLGDVVVPGDVTYEFDHTYVLKTLENAEKELKQPEKRLLVQQQKLHRFVPHETRNV